MSNTTHKKFLVLYQIPAQVMDEWAATPPEQRQQAEAKVRGEWGKWIGEHMKSVVSTEAAGKTKLVNASGISDSRNDIVLYSIIQADSHDEASQMFKNHPHLQIRQASIQIMEIRAMGEM